MSAGEATDDIIIHSTDYSAIIKNNKTIMYKKNTHLLIGKTAKIYF